jgi:hypothetical protein
MLSDPFSVDGSPKLLKKVYRELQRSTSHRNSRADRIVALAISLEEPAVLALPQWYKYGFYQ